MNVTDLNASIQGLSQAVTDLSGRIGAIPSTDLTEQVNAVNAETARVNALLPTP